MARTEKRRRPVAAFIESASFHKVRLVEPTLQVRLVSEPPAIFRFPWVVRWVVKVREPRQPRENVHVYAFSAAYMPR